MSSTASKKRRSPNWEDGEKTVLRQCVAIFAHIIENKKTDTNTNKAKTKAWKSVLQNFNEENRRQRNLEEIKTQWRVQKQTAKKGESEFKKAYRATGGGPKPPSPPPEIVKIITMNPNEFETDVNKFDSDYKKNNSKKLPEFLTEKENNWQNPNTAKRAKQSNDVFEGKLRRDTETLKLLKEEHDVKVKLMQERHEWKRIEHELRKKNLELLNIMLKRQLEEM